MYRVLTIICIVSPAFCTTRIPENLVCTNSRDGTCLTECGKVTSVDSQLEEDVRYAGRGELPWNVAIYTKKYTPYLRICAGSVISTKLVISGAVCFWDTVKELQLPIENYAVAVGKLFSHWNNPNDKDAQKSDVTDIKIFERYAGGQTNYQGDIALVVLSTPLEFNEYVRPICLDFDEALENRQLKTGNLGRIASFGRVENDPSSQKLRIVDLPYLDIENCITDAPGHFISLITVDKICAGYKSGSEICKGDSGGGLAFPETAQGITRYYLRGILSVAPVNEYNTICNVYNLTGYTHVAAYKGFILQHLQETRGLVANKSFTDL